MNYTDIDLEVIYGMEGVIDYKEYIDHVINGIYFGFPASLAAKFPGYNEGTGFRFPFWSSPAITKSFTMQAYGKYHILQENK